MGYSVIIVAAGKGERFSATTSKILHPLANGKRVVEQSMDVFLRDPNCSQVILVLNEEGMEYFKAKPKRGRLVLVRGGSSRQESVFYGLMAVKEETVLIHDGARPWVEEANIRSLVETLETEEAALLVVPVQDTMKVVKDGYVIDTIDRNQLRRAQTPQGFHTQAIVACYKQAMEQGLVTTDDAQLYQMITGKPLKCVDGSFANEKITTIYDVQRR
ncbi:MAG: 2-C-methyl-D-erythritol 4-phosphate cytidylyltransferase [Erysipelotrichaceae bacterium]|nr:2-C-methyl-D-erythritol 4-phosphate cytidylyltransferase [Erysipelotrichaceae bacterium]